MALKKIFLCLVLNLIFTVSLIHAKTDLSIARDKNGNFFILTQPDGIIYKTNPEGKLLLEKKVLFKGTESFTPNDILFFESDAFGKIFAYKFDTMEIIQLDSDLNFVTSWFINHDLKALPAFTIGSNDNFFVRLPYAGFVEYSKDGKTVSEMLKETKCTTEKNKMISIGARGKITAYNRNNILLWFVKNNGMTEVLKIDLEKGTCNSENLGSYINHLAYDNKGRLIILAHSWIDVRNFSSIKGNTKAYPKPLKPIAITIDNLDNYYIVNQLANEILVLKDTGTLKNVVTLDKKIKIN